MRIVRDNPMSVSDLWYEELKRQHLVPKEDEADEEEEKEKTDKAGGRNEGRRTEDVS